MANSTVKKAATQRGKLQRNSFSVLGVFGPKDGLRALVRTSNGRVKQVGAGERVSTGKVVAIDDKGLILRQSGQNRRFDIPGR